MDAHTLATNGETEGVELRSTWLDKVSSSHWQCSEIELYESGMASVECRPRRWHPGYWLMRIRQAIGIESKVTNVYVGAPE